MIRSGYIHIFTTMKKILLLLSIFIVSINVTAQTALPIPPVLSGSTIDLYMADSSKQFFSGLNTATIGYNGAYLGPTIMLEKWQQVTLNVHNQINDTTSAHWHGLHVSPANDGGPHTMIMSASTWSPSFTVLDHAGTYWYHPHMHMKTMHQVLMGAAGMIIVKDSVEAALTLPRTYGIDDFPLALQFQHFDSTTGQIVMDDELDNAALVNGVLVSPYLDAPAQVVRLRLLNASSHRFFQLGFSDNRNFHVIASDAGLLDAPVVLNRILLSPGERMEILVDFSGQSGTSVSLRQYGTQLPAGYPGGPPDAMGMMLLGPLDNTNFDLLQINVVAETAEAIHSIPTSLTTNVVHSTTGAGSYALRFTGSPAMSMTNFLMNGVQFDMNVINFTVEQDSVMIWNITNQSMMPHPFHLHGNHFYVLSVDGATPPTHLRGRKDVITVRPMGGTVSLISKYADFSDPMIPYMYHCHILSHEDHGMMGQFIVSPRTTSINTIDKNAIRIYPNPASNTIMIEEDNVNIKLARITDVTGRIVMTINEPGNKQPINISSLAQGTYVLTLTDENGKYHKSRFIKQ